MVRFRGRSAGGLRRRRIRYLCVSGAGSRGTGAGTVRSARRFVAATLTAWNLNHLKEAACLPVFAERWQ